VFVSDLETERNAHLFCREYSVSSDKPVVLSSASLECCFICANK
jgi:hypothetical protein